MQAIIWLNSPLKLNDGEYNVVAAEVINDDGGRVTITGAGGTVSLDAAKVAYPESGDAADLIPLVDQCGFLDLRF